MHVKNLKINFQNKTFYIITILIVIILALLVFLIKTHAPHKKRFDKEYLQISNIKQQQLEFVNILLPYIHEANNQILSQRKYIIRTFTRVGSKPSIKDLRKHQKEKLQNLAKQYRISDILNEQAFLNKVNTIPVSMALSQAALESGWGKSRFAQEGNNLFGQWTYSGKGIIPAKRPKGAIYKVAIYNSLQDSVNAYMLNINSQQAYAEFRKIRAKYTAKDQAYPALIAIKTMHKYSGLGDQYATILRKIIISNNFEQYS